MNWVNSRDALSMMTGTQRVFWYFIVIAIIIIIIIIYVTG